jgi:hypothetical protein
MRASIPLTKLLFVPDGTRKVLALECPHFTIEQTAGRSKLTTSSVDYNPLATFKDWQMSGSIYEPAIVSLKSGCFDITNPFTTES